MSGLRKGALWPMLSEVGAREEGLRFFEELKYDWIAYQDLNFNLNPAMFVLRSKSPSDLS